MKKVLTIMGRITSQPQICGSFTEFFLCSGQERYRIARSDPQWQIKDLLFLCIGQGVSVSGTEAEACILADEIQITDCRERNYLITDGEENYGNSCDTGTDPVDPAL